MTNEVTNSGLALTFFSIAVIEIAYSDILYLPDRGNKGSSVGDGGNVVIVGRLTD